MYPLMVLQKAAYRVCTNRAGERAARILGCKPVSCTIGPACDLETRRRLRRRVQSHRSGLCITPAESPGYRRLAFHDARPPTARRARVGALVPRIVDRSPSQIVIGLSDRAFRAIGADCRSTISPRTQCRRISSIASWRWPLLTTVSRPVRQDSAPVKSLVRPPASSTMMIPAATSQA